MIETLFTILFNIVIDLGKMILTMYIGMAILLALLGCEPDEIAYIAEEATKAVYNIITRKKDSD